MNWQELKKSKQGPLMVLAPLADVTDPAFRRLIAKYGKPDAMYTEFVSADGLFTSPVREYCQKLIEGKINREEFEEVLSNGVGGSALVKDLVYSEGERPIIAQFFTSKPEMMKKASELAVELGFDGIDINMGCPDKSVEKQGAGAGLIKTPELAKEIILAAKSGTGNLPVSVKTRIGYNKNELETWLPAILSTQPSVVTIHARTRKEMSLVPARWEHVKRAVEIRDELQSDIPVDERTLIFGNGDALDIEHAKKLANESGADGVMLGRAIFGTPWLFSNSRATKISSSERGRDLKYSRGELENRADKEVRKKILNILVEHTKLFEELCSHKSFAVMKKHYKAYVNGWDGAKELRMKLMECNSASEVETVVMEYVKTA